MSPKQTGPDHARAVADSIEAKWVDAPTENRTDMIHRLEGVLPELGDDDQLLRTQIAHLIDRIRSSLHADRSAHVAPQPVMGMGLGTMAGLPSRNNLE
jgi:hypothetical protein